MADCCSYSVETYAAGDGYRWHYRHFRPAGPPRAHVIGIHGIQSHGGWYECSCDRLRTAGFAVSFLDRRGSGLNPEGRGDATSFRRLLDDLAEFLTWVRTADDPTLPVFLMAISWGGKLVVALERRHPGLLDGLALVCPGFFPKVRPSVQERWGIAWARLTDPSKLFPVPLNDPELFTANRVRQAFIREDPLALRQCTARLFVESARLDGYLRFVPRYVRVPTVLFLAGQDRIIDNARTRRFMEGFAAGEKEIIEYPEAHHTLEFEPEFERFLSDLTRWLEKRSVAVPGSLTSQKRLPPGRFCEASLTARQHCTPKGWEFSAQGNALGKEFPQTDST